jgi:hypothetical protein
MDTGHAKVQPQDPVAAKLGIYAGRIGIIVVALLWAASLIRG